MRRALTSGLPLAFFLFLAWPPPLHGPVNPLDEGAWLSLLHSLMNGGRLYRDVWCQYGPGLLLPVKALLSWMAPTLENARFSFWIANAAGLLCVYAALAVHVRAPLLRAVFGAFLALVPAAAHAPIPLAARYGAAFLSLCFWPSAVSAGRPAAAGAAAALAALVSQEAGVAVFVAGLVMFWRREPRGGPSLARFAVGASAVAVGAGILSLLSGTLPDVAASFLDTGRLVGSRRTSFPVPRPDLWVSWATGRIDPVIPWQNLSDALAAYIPPLSWGFLLFRRPAGAERRAAALVVFAALLSVAAWARPDRWHLYFALSPTLLLWALWAEASQPLSSRRGGAMLLCFLALGAAITFPPFHVRRIKESLFRRIYRPAALARAGGSLLPSGQAEAYEMLDRWTRANVPGRTGAFFYPYNGAYYFLCDRVNPSRFASPVDAVSAAQQEALVSDLEKARIDWVIVDEQDTAFDGVPVDQRLPLVKAYMDAHFRPAGREGPFLFLRRVRL